jgi:hypothetical protein
MLKVGLNARIFFPSSPSHCGKGCSKPFQEANERNECVCTAPFEADMASGSLQCRLKAAITTNPTAMTEYVELTAIYHDILVRNVALMNVLVTPLATSQ